MVGVLAEDFLPPAPKAAKKANGAAAGRAPRPGDSVVAALAAAPSPDAIKPAALDSVRAIQLIRAYRVRGHLAANLDPLRSSRRAPASRARAVNFGFLPQDLDRPIFLDNVLGLQYATMREIVEICRATYCGNIGHEFMPLTDPDQKRWIQERIEGRDKDDRLHAARARRRSSTS